MRKPLSLFLSSLLKFTFVKFLYSIISTFFGIGKIPFMPGTFGSLAATILVAVIFYQPYFIELKDSQMHFGVGGGYINPDYIVYVITILALFFWIIGIWASERYSKQINKEDPKQVVIDEVAGIFVSFSLISLIYSGLYLLNNGEFIIYLVLMFWVFPVTFILFRIFDIWKPWHVGYADKHMKGGVGIMADDIIAGVYTAISFYIIFFVLKLFGVLDHLVSVDNF